jgi:hypothetical protein
MLLHLQNSHLTQIEFEKHMLGRSAIEQESEALIRA